MLSEENMFCSYANRILPASQMCGIMLSKTVDQRLRSHVYRGRNATIGLPGEIKLCFLLVSSVLTMSSHEHTESSPMEN
jgi:hypothetical protein